MTGAQPPTSPPNRKPLGLFLPSIDTYAETSPNGDSPRAPMLEATERQTENMATSRTSRQEGQLTKRGGEVYFTGGDDGDAETPSGKLVKQTSSKISDIPGAALAQST